VLQSDPGNAFYCGTETVHMMPGELWWFNHKTRHWFENASLRPRWHMIIDAQCPSLHVERKQGVTFQRETPGGLWGEIAPLLRAHWREIAHYQDIPLEVNQGGYEQVEAAGKLRAYTARSGDGALIGYAVYIVGPNLHYSSSIQAKQDVLFVLPERRKSTVGLRLIKFADDQLRAEGVQVVYQHSKVAHDIGPVMLRCGYELVEHIYARRLD
jgi:GNAT superfamily N-acetyltransferase